MLRGLAPVTGLTFASTSDRGVDPEVQRLSSHEDLASSPLSPGSGPARDAASISSDISPLAKQEDLKVPPKVAAAGTAGALGFDGRVSF